MIIFQFLTINVAEDKVSDVENRMMEIYKAEREKEKRIKRKEDNFRDHRSPRRRREKERP